MQVLMTGASGLIGQALTGHLRTAGHDIVAISRQTQPARQGVTWVVGAPDDPATYQAALAHCDAIVNLAGAPIATLWTQRNRGRIADSRVKTTTALVSALRTAPKRPRVWLNASAVGFYGVAPAGTCDESSTEGSGFIADVARTWEAAAHPIKHVEDTRLVFLRFGIVLARQGGALPQMVRPVKAFVGGPVGDGQQWVSWVHLDDAVNMIAWALSHASIEGPLNVVAPNPISNETLMATIARLLHRPNRLRLPQALVRMALGDMGQELLLGGQDVVPKVALAHGFHFSHAFIENALQDLLGHNTQP